jgi:hypothetical protein
MKTSPNERVRMKRRKVVGVNEVLTLFFGGQFGIWTDYCFREARFHLFADRVLAAALLSAVLLVITSRPQGNPFEMPDASPVRAFGFRFLVTFALGFSAAFCLNYPPGHRYEPAGVLMTTMLTTTVVMVVAATAFGIRYERK